MSALPPIVQFGFIMFAGWVNRQQLDLFDYFKEENRVLREMLDGRPLRFSGAHDRTPVIRAIRYVGFSYNSDRGRSQHETQALYRGTDHYDPEGARVQSLRAWSCPPSWRSREHDLPLDILVQPRRDKRAAKRFFRKLMKGMQYSPRKIVTDKFRSYAAARKEVMPTIIHEQGKQKNNRIECSH
jgi:hypothetical protein